MSQDESPTKDCNTVIVPVRIVGDSLRLNIEEHSEVYYPTVSITHTIIPEPELAEPKTETPVPLSETVEKLDETPKLKRSILKTILSMFGTFITAAAATIAVVLVGVKIVGIKTFTVLSGSMEPDYPVGSMIYVRPKDYKELKVGDVISYVANNEKTIVTHRIVDIVVDEKDPEVLRFKTKGDANSSADANLVHYKNVIGTPTIAIPYLGYFAHTIQQPPGIYIALVVGTLLLAWAFLPGTLEERRKTARKSIAN
ncbi:signal peptidase I [Candidatus Saccharibacteria bacterium]|nr:signal peptidase I [Candidatus Saccharibacteria bacterium]